MAYAVFSGEPRHTAAASLAMGTLTPISAALAQASSRSFGPLRLDTFVARLSTAAVGSSPRTGVAKKDGAERREQTQWPLAVAS